MKKIRKNTFKSIITTMLTIAIALTGISFNSTTANAAVTTTTLVKAPSELDGKTDITDLNGTVMTMKPGDTKQLIVTYEYGVTQKYKHNDTESYAWTSSDESVVIMDRMWFEQERSESLKLFYVEIEAAKAGTSVITAADNRNHKVISITVNVEEPEKTEKQLKCKKHVWKTTKKATCSRVGIKTCKKCKLQKVTSRKQHEYETVCEERYEYTYAVAYICGGCTCGDPSHVGSLSCPNACWETFDQREYGSAEAAWQARSDHKSKSGHGSMGNWHFIQTPVGRETTYKDVDVCKLCGYDRPYLEMVSGPNDPNGPTKWTKDM